MAVFNVYFYDTSILQQDFKFLIYPTVSSETSTQFVLSNIGILQDKITFLGNFTLSSGAITGGTITEVQVHESTALSADITGLSIPVTASGTGFSFSTGAIFPSGSTYYARSSGGGLTGVGNDTFYGEFQTTITPGLGTNVIHADASGIQINLKGSLGSDVLITSSAGGSLTVVDISSSGTASDQIIGSAKLLFEGNDTFVQDSNGVLSLTTTAAKAGSAASSVVHVSVSDTAQNVGTNLDTLQKLAAAGDLSSITLIDGGTPTLTITATQYNNDSLALQDIQGSYTIVETGVGVKAATGAFPANVNQVMVLDSAANVFASLDTLQSLEAAGKVVNVMLTDGNTPTMTITAAQDAADAKLLAGLALTGSSPIVGSFALDVTAGGAGGTITGFDRIATTVTFSGAASAYSIAGSGDGSDLTVTGSGATYHLSNVQALQFSDREVLVTASPGQGAVTTGNMAELYGAVFGREPDLPGLAYYQGYLNSNPGTPLAQYAQWFLNSSEYTGNPAHNYAQTAVGDQQFISDSYQNLLHRTPSADEVAYYENNVIAPALKGLQAGTAAYASADLAAHALTLVYFSASSEFLGDVRITPGNPASAQHWLILA